MKRGTLKLGNMRKAKAWVVYPRKPEQEDVQIQCDTRIARFRVADGLGLLSAHKANGAYGVHLNPGLGATVVTVPPEVVKQCLEAAPKSGDMIGPGVYVA